MNYLRIICLCDIGDNKTELFECTRLFVLFICTQKQVLYFVLPTDRSFGIIIIFCSLELVLTVQIVVEKIANQYACTNGTWIPLDVIGRIFRVY